MCLSSCALTKKSGDQDTNLNKKKFKGTFAYFYQDFEPSGIVYHEQTNLFYVVSDHGLLVSVEPSGEVTQSWFLDGDLEGITINPLNTDRLYIVDENTHKILEFSIKEEEVVVTWDLSSDGSLNDQEFEALTYLPNTHGNNYFIAGSQTDGNIYKFHLEMLDSSKSQNARLVSVHRVNDGLKDLAGLHYDKRLDRIFAIYDDENTLAIMSSLDLTMMEKTDLFGRNQEGITIVDCELYIAEDKDARVLVKRLTDVLDRDDVCPN